MQPLDVWNNFTADIATVDYHCYCYYTKQKPKLNEFTIAAAGIVCSHTYADPISPRCRLMGQLYTYVDS